jgi:rod shape-determining protein MreD
LIETLPRDVLPDPPDIRLIVASISVAYLLSLLPWTGVPLLVRPDFALLVLLYWCIHQPRRVGQSAAFGLGLLVDVSEGTVLGLHGLTYSIAMYMALRLRLRLLSFKLWQQALHVLAFLLAAQALTALLSVLLYETYPGWQYFFGAAIGAALWAPLSLVLEYPRLRSARAHVP